MKALHKKILTLIDIEAPIQAIIKCRVNLAGPFDAKVKFLYMKSTQGAIRTENQLSAVGRMTERQHADSRFQVVLKNLQWAQTVVRTLARSKAL